MTEQQDQQRWAQCPVCEGYFIHYAFSLQKHRVVKCGNCGLVGINPQPSAETLKAIYGAQYFPLSDTPEGEKHSRLLKYATAQHYLDTIENYLRLTGKPVQGARLLEIGVGFGDFLEAARNRGYEVAGIEYSAASAERARNRLGRSARIIQGEVADLPASERFDVIVFNDVLEHVRDPLHFLGKVYEALNEKGIVFCVIPSLDSRSAKLQGTDWVEFKLEHLFYFNDGNARRLFVKTGFEDIVVLPARKTLSIKYIAAHFEAHPRPFWNPMFKTTLKVIPNTVLEHPFNIVASGIILMAGKQSDLQRPLKLSVVMAVYNEAPTVRKAIEGVLAKKVRNCDIDLIIIESNSSDGSREIVKKFSEDSRVGILLEEQPRGKGHAIRQGLKAAKGDIVLIQDADLEYDFEDYDALIDALRDGGETFVLGSRHGGEKWKVRHFEGQRIVAFLANTVHWALTYMINVLFGVRLTDPFTMFKVFRRSAIQGLQFQCNRFDFDYELLLKLIRTGHKPVELPVNYSARSFKEGKKVRFFRDPLTWVWAILKFRFVKL